MDYIERLKAANAITTWSYEYIYFVNTIDILGITFKVVFNEKDFTYCPVVLLKSSIINTLKKDINENYINSIKKFNNFYDAYIFGVDIVIFLTITIYVRNLNETEHTNKHINYISDELPIPYIISKILEHNSESYYEIIKDKILHQVDWTELINSFTRQLISEWDD